MSKLIILPGSCDVIGGTLITLSLLIKGFQLVGAFESLCVLVRSGSIMESYLQKAEQGACLQLINAQTEPQFVQQALQWVRTQPADYPLLLDNCVERQLIPVLIRSAPALRLSRRPIYYFFHDLALSHNHLGYLARKIAFTCLAPVGLCNSQFTARHIRRFATDMQGILYQPVDMEKFNDQPPYSSPPVELQPILRSGARIILTPSRLNKPGIFNDKNLRVLIPMLAHLKAMGHFYHSVIVGEDTSPDQICTRSLLAEAEQLGVADRLTILPPTFSIENYYKYANVMVTLAPREPFGRTVVEAIACGVPVVGSRTGGIGEILNNFAPEWTVDPNDPVAAAETIIRIAADSNTPNVIAKGMNWIENHCSVVDYARRIIEITGLASAERSLVKL